MTGSSMRQFDKSADIVYNGIGLSDIDANFLPYLLWTDAVDRGESSYAYLSTSQ